MTNREALIHYMGKALATQRRHVVHGVSIPWTEYVERVQAVLYRSDLIQATLDEAQALIRAGREADAS